MSPTTSGIKRKSSDSSGGSDNKNMKMDADNVSMDAIEKLFNSDHCVRAILAYLSLKDLANVSRAGHFLKNNAIIVFKTVHASTIELNCDGNDFSQHQIIFRQFGSLATKVEVSTGTEGDPFHDDGGKILRTIGHFCGSNLTDLTLSRLLIDLSSSNYSPKNRIEIRRILATLKKLTLISVCIKSRFLIGAYSLEELFVHSCCHIEQLPEVTTLHQLRILHIGACVIWPFGLPGESFSEFSKMNPSIEEIDYHFFIIREGHLESICSLPKLTHLQIPMFKYDGEKLSLIAKNARKLKKLTLHVDPRDRCQYLEFQKMLPTGCECSIKDIRMMFQKIN